MFVIVVAPRIVPVTRWSRAAPNIVSNKNKTISVTQSTLISDQLISIVKGAHARLTCVIAAEPNPEVNWLREPANLTLIEGGQFHSVVKSIRPGLYHAILYLIQPQEVDLGRYFCKVSLICIIKYIDIIVIIIKRDHLTKSFETIVAWFHIHGLLYDFINNISLFQLRYPICLFVLFLLLLKRFLLD